MNRNIDDDDTLQGIKLSVIYLPFDIWLRIELLFYKTHSSVEHWFIFIISYAHLWHLVVNDTKISIKVLKFKSWFIYMWDVQFQPHQLMRYPMTYVNLMLTLILIFPNLINQFIQSLVVWFSFVMLKAQGPLFDKTTRLWRAVLYCSRRPLFQFWPDWQLWP